jgi:hypothetical protein
MRACISSGFFPENIELFRRALLACIPERRDRELRLSQVAYHGQINDAHDVVEHRAQHDGHAQLEYRPDLDAKPRLRRRRLLCRTTSGTMCGGDWLLALHPRLAASLVVVLLTAAHR